MCKILTRAKVTTCAKVTPRALVALCAYAFKLYDSVFFTQVKNFTTGI